MRYSFEEYKVYYESTEKVTDRRIANNQWNYSVCVALMVAMALVWSWSAGNSKFAFLSLTIVAGLAVLGALFSTFWIQQIMDFKALNHAKFTVLNEMASGVSMGRSSDGQEIGTANPFNREWEFLEQQHALTKLKKNNFTALKASKIEFYIPQTIRMVFVIMFLISSVPIIVHPISYCQAWKIWLQLFSR